MLPEHSGAKSLRSPKEMAFPLAALDSGNDSGQNALRMIFVWQSKCGNDCIRQHVYNAIYMLYGEIIQVDVGEVNFRNIALWN